MGLIETYGHGQCDGLPVTQLIMPPDTGDRAGARRERERVTPTGTRGELHARSGGVFLLSGSSAFGVCDRFTARRICWGSIRSRRDEQDFLVRATEAD